MAETVQAFLHLVFFLSYKSTHSKKNNLEGMPVWKIVFFLLLCAVTVDSACNIFLQSTNIAYLDSTQLSLFNISDQCTTTCTNGYYGDFCQDLSQYSRLPMGPWNQAGYCTAGPGILRSMTMDVSLLSSIQYTKKDSVLIGIAYPGATTNAGARASVISEVSLYSSTTTSVLYPTPGGSLNALTVRKGVVYVSRLVQISGSDTYDIAVLEAPMQARKLISTPVKAWLFDVCVDKGTVTYYIYGSSGISACYPSGTCNTWVSTIPTVSGMLVGADCRKTVYISSLTNILSVTSAGASLLKSTDTTIYCLTGIPDINVLLYKSKNSMWQINLGTGATQSLPLGVTQTQEVMCSTDVSENSNQILIVQNGVISTLEAVQEPCSFGKTSQALLCNSTAQCTACPPPPSNAYTVEGSVSCEWVCRAGFAQMGSKCVDVVPLPCPEHYRISPTPGLCAPSVLPWAEQGKYALPAAYSVQLLLPVQNAQAYMLASVYHALVYAVPGYFYLSLNGGASWTELGFTTYSAATCYYSVQNSYYYLSARRGILWTAFTQQRVTAQGVQYTQHCLWSVNATDAINSQGSKTLSVLQAWAIDRHLCSVTDDSGLVYALLCGNNYVSSARSGSALSPLIGTPLPGYNDGTFQAARFKSPSSVVAHDSRLYIADTGNCVIREVDLVRSTVLTVAGTAGTCQRSDGAAGATLTYPILLSYTAYPGFFLFVDRNINGQFEYVRQFHAPTSTVSTVQASPFTYSQISSLAGSRNGVIAMAQRAYYVYNATPSLCPAGTSSLAGNAFDTSGCLACPAYYYSDASGACNPCATPSCALPGQLFVPCQLGSNAYCGSCTNKPAGNSKYVGPSSIPGTSSGGGDCAWVYTPPCPVGYYNGTDGTCLSCPAWSTTARNGSRSISDCSCMGNGRWLNGACVIPSPYAANPSICNPLSSCGVYTEPSTLFPILPGCTSFDMDSYSGVCPCQSGEYIQQIYPKVCTACPAGLYSPSGRGCKVCPYLTEPSMDKTSCRCTAGTTDTALALADPQCVCGPGQAFDASIGCTPCPVNTYNTAVRGYSAAGPMQCSPCAAGTWSSVGSTDCTQCLLGRYRTTSDPACMDCRAGSYAPIPTSPLCVDCVADCNGRREIQCPTDSALYMCYPCPTPRPNSAFNGQRDCATSCNAGFYELDGECVQCSRYYKATCPVGNSFVECSSYADAGCVGCVNSSMPLNFAVWAYRSSVPDGPSLVCEWECEAGYSPQRPPLPGGVEAAWECVRAGEWSVWDLFTL